MEYKPGTNQFTRSKTSHDTFKLDSINNDRAVVSIDTTIWHMAGGQTQSNMQLTYKAKRPPTPPSDNRIVTTGDETLTINGKQFACKWEKVANAKNPDEDYTETWRSDEVPGGLVLMQVHARSMATGPRSITETIYAPLDGVTPEQGSKAGADASATPASQPAQTNRALTNSGTAKGSSSGADAHYTNTNGAAPGSQSPGTSTNADTAQTADSTKSNSAPAVTSTTNDSAPPANQPNANVHATQPAGGEPAGGHTTVPFRVPGVPNVFGARNRMPAAQPQSQTDQMAMMRRYNAAMVRTGSARNGLNQFQRSANGTPRPLPDDIRAASGRLLTQQRAVTIALRSRDTASTNQDLQELESTLKLIEDFLSANPRL